MRRWEQREDRCAPRLIELGDEVGRIVGPHLRKHRGSFGIGLVAQELDLVLGVQLLEHIGLELRVTVHRGDDLLALVVRRGLDEVGDLRGMQAAEAAQRHEQPRRRNVTHERLDRRPVDESLLLAARCE